ncbi:MAG: hypothetical protein AAF826_04900 [Pseudomonadota bacterium]
MILYFVLAVFLLMIPVGAAAFIWMKLASLEFFLGFNDWFWAIVCIGGAIGSFQLMIDLGILG